MRATLHLRMIGLVGTAVVAAGSLACGSTPETQGTAADGETTATSAPATALDAASV